MIYGGAQSGIWGKIIFEHYRKLRIIAIEANPYVFVHHFPNLSNCFTSYINAALSNRSGTTNIYFPRTQVNS